MNVVLEQTLGRCSGRCARSMLTSSHARAVVLMPSRELSTSDLVRDAAVFRATGCAGLFSGSALSTTLVEHRARMECGPELAVAEFVPSYRRATLLQATLGLTGTAAGAVAF